MEFKDIPVQQDGRVKPLDTFSRNHLLRFNGKRSTGTNLSPSEWLFSMAVNKNDIKSIPIFNIRNPEVAHTLSLEWNEMHRYSLKEVLEGIEREIDIFNNLHTKNSEDMTIAEKQLTEIYLNIISYKNIESSLLCLAPIILVDNQEVADAIKVNIGDKVSYFRFIQYIDNMNSLIRSHSIKDEKELTPTDSSFFMILENLNEVYDSRNSQGLKIIPPSSISNEEKWLSPWELMDGRMLETFQIKMLLELEEYIAKNSKKSINLYTNILYSLSLETLPEISILKREVWYNKVNLFYKSTALYLLSFLFLSFSFIFKSRRLDIFSFPFLLAGLSVHGLCLYIRMLIMGRPPISTLYETIIFVGFIGVLFSVFLEIFRKDRIGIFMASFLGIVFHYISFGYAADGDTLGMLVAVLNSNFWLATHVTTIIIGYGASIIAGFMGHIYLIYSITYTSKTKKIREIYDTTFAMTLIALFFTVFGTILGGIWADQSWGRFWGWDPKENGALLICMWQILMIHMRLTGIVKGRGFALGMIINNIIVALAWFGVNLLNVGLHSYGFASGIAFNLSLFIIFELSTGFFTYYLSSKKKNI